MNFGNCVHLCNLNHNQNMENFHHPEVSLCFFVVNPLSQALIPGNN